MKYFKESTYNLYYSIDNKTVVYNIVSGSGAYVDQDTLMSIKTGDVSNIESQQELAKLGFIVPSKVNEYLRLKEIALGEVWNPNPREMLFVITPSMGCNLNCKYCFESHHVRKGASSVMSDEIQEKIIDFIGHKIIHGSKKLLSHVSLSFFGGEPTLHLDSVCKISSAIKRICQQHNVLFDARIITNAVLLTESNGRRLKEAGVSRAQITLDGMAEDYAKRKGVSISTFDTVIRNICDNADILRIKIRVNVDEDNKNTVPILMEHLFDSNGLKDRVSLYFAQIKKWNDNDEISFISSKSYGDCLEHYFDTALKRGWIKSIIKKPPKIRTTSCGMIRSGSIGIGYDGSLFRCTHGFSDPNNAVIGDIFSGLYANAYDYNYRTWDGMKKCEDCKYFPVCWGGCRNNALLYNDYPDCELVRKETDLCVLYSFLSQNESV